jgi:hypothetical protein
MVPRDEIQLVAAVCLWISTKIEEPFESSLVPFMAICQDQFPADVFRQKELEIVSLLGCRLDFSTSQFYLIPFLTEIDRCDQERQVQFWIDISRYEYEFIELAAPVVVVASICAVLGEQCPFERLCTAAQIQRDVGLVLEIMKKLLKVVSVLLPRKSPGIESGYPMAEIHELMEKMRQNIGFFSQYPE